MSGRSVGGWPIAEEIASRIDHTILRPDATEEDVLRHCGEAASYSFGVVFVQGCWAEIAVRRLAGTGIAVGTVAGFPQGATFTAAKAREAEQAVRAGASEVDMVLNVGWLKGGRENLVLGDIRQVREALGGAARLKVILETGYLLEEEKRLACRLAEEAGASYVKTCTGYGPSGATTDDVRLLREAVGDRLGVKASGGIRDLDSALALLEAGADRIGTSSGVAIIEAARRRPLKR